jgi:hypothetical protein
MGNNFIENLLGKLMERKIRKNTDEDNKKLDEQARLLETESKGLLNLQEINQAIGNKVDAGSMRRTAIREMQGRLAHEAIVNVAHGRANAMNQELDAATDKKQAAESIAESAKRAAEKAAKDLEEVRAKITGETKA